MSVLQCWWDSRRSLALPSVLLALLILGAAAGRCPECHDSWTRCRRKRRGRAWRHVTITSPALLVPQSRPVTAKAATCSPICRSALSGGLRA